MALTLAVAAGCRRPEPASGAETAADRPALEVALPPAGMAQLTKLEQSLQARPQDPARQLALARLYHANRYGEAADALYARLDPAAPGLAPGQLAYYRADLARQRGDLPAAEQHLRQTLREAPDYLPARLSLGEVQAKLGRPEAAQEHFEAVLAAEPGHAQASLALAREELRQGRRDAATQRLERLASAHPGYTEGLFLLAQLLARAGEPERAAQLREQGRAGWDLPPPDPWIDALREQCHDPQQLSIWFEDLHRVGRGNDGLRYLDRIEELDPASAQPHLQRAKHFLSQQQLPAAEAELRRAADKGADPLVLYPEWLKTLVTLGWLEEAERVARRGLDLAPGSPVVHAALGGLRLRQGDFSAALTHLQQALVLDPQDSLAHQLLAHAYVARGDLARAGPHLEALARANPRDVSARRLLAQQRLEAGDLAGATPFLAEVHQLEPEDDEVRHLLARTHLGVAEAARAAGRADDALRAVEAALAVQPDLGEALRLRVPLLVEQGAFAAAERALAPLLRQEPLNPRYLVALGNVQRAAGRPEEAVATWRRALGLLTGAEEAQLRPVLEDLIRQAGGGR